MQVHKANKQQSWQRTERQNYFNVEVYGLCNISSPMGQRRQVNDANYYRRCIERAN